MKKKNQYIIIGSIIAVAIASYFGYKYYKRKKLTEQLAKSGVISSSVQKSSTTTSGVTKNKDGSILITGHDTVWDYKFENGRWYTRKKGTETWIDMKNNLSSENYSLAIERLEKYIATNK